MEITRLADLVIHITEIRLNKSDLQVFLKHKQIELSTIIRSNIHTESEQINRFYCESQIFISTHNAYCLN